MVGTRSLTLEGPWFGDMAGFPAKYVCQAVGNSMSTLSDVHLVLTQTPAEVKNLSAQNLSTIDVFNARE